MTSQNCGTLEPQILLQWENGVSRPVCNDPKDVVFDTNLEILLGFERAYRSFERDVLLATKRKEELATLASKRVFMQKQTKPTKKKTRNINASFETDVQLHPKEGKCKRTKPRL